MMVGNLNYRNAAKILKIVNRTILAEFTTTPFTPNELQGTFASFVIETRRNSQRKSFLFMKLSHNYYSSSFLELREKSFLSR
jgi:hypothetical protein